MLKENEFNLEELQRLTIIGGVTSIGLAAVKITTGVAGNSYALIADGIESLTDLVSSIAVFLGVTWSIKPPDEKHPYGHGKLETLASLFVSMSLIIAASVIAWESTGEITSPQESPSWFTLPVLVLIVLIKLSISRMMKRGATSHGSAALEADAWHHLSDAITSGAAFIGISIALLGGDEWAAADDWAALVACTVILFNGCRLSWESINELLESSAPDSLDKKIRRIAEEVDGVYLVEKMRVRKSGLAYLMDIHIEVEAELTVREGHEIARDVKNTLLDAGLRIVDVTVHVEPYEGEAER